MDGRFGDHNRIHITNFEKVAKIYSTRLDNDHELTYNPIRHETEYRLGDAIFGRFKPIQTKKYHLKYYPNSIVSMYFKQTSQFGNLQVLANTVRYFKEIYSDIPPKDSIVIHLRLGDVIEQCTYSVDQHLNADIKYSENKFHYESFVKPKKYFDDKLQKIHELRKTQKLQPLKKIIMVYGYHLPHLKMTRSQEYTQKLKQHFESQGYTCSIRTSGSASSQDADADFVFLCHAKYFIRSGGGYSELAEKIQHIINN